MKLLQCMNENKINLDLKKFKNLVDVLMYVSNDSKISLFAESLNRVIDFNIQYRVIK